MSETKANEAKQDTSFAPWFLILALVIVLLALIFSPDRPSAPGTSPLLFGMSTPVPRPGTPSFACQPGIAAGKTANVVYSAVRMRHSAGYVDKNDATDTKRYLKSGDQVVVRGGPEIRDGLCWWLVEHKGIQGWTADHSREGRLLLSAGP
jgi:hypothetical protein